jgi:signal transduction histidine kinase
LSVIKTEAESLRDSIITDKESLDQIERIRKVNLNILKEVENLRKWILKSPHPVNLNTAIIQAVNEANKRGGVKSKVKLDTSGFPADLPETLGSQLLLTEVFAELIQNADKAIDKKGWIKISGKTLILDGKQMNLVLIEDNGRGIPEDDLEKIFDRGYSTGSSTKKGLGFGLWWIRSYIERLGGFVSVESQFGKGSLFKVVLPCSEVN